MVFVAVGLEGHTGGLCEGLWSTPCSAGPAAAGWEGGRLCEGAAWQSTASCLALVARRIPNQDLQPPPTAAPRPSDQAGIVACGGLRPLLDLLVCSHNALQHNAAFALYGLSDNEDNVADIVREGGLQRLLECSEKLQVQASKVRGRGA